MNLANIIMMSIFIEALINYFKEWFINKDVIWQQIVALVIGVFLAIAFQVDLPETFGLHSVVPFVGQVMTGIIFSRGSNYVADLIKKLNSHSEPDPNTDQIADLGR